MNRQQQNKKLAYPEILQMLQQQGAFELSTDIERSVIASMIQSKEAQQYALATIGPVNTFDKNPFVDDAYSLYYRALNAISEQGQLPDVIKMGQYIQKHSTWNEDDRDRIIGLFNLPINLTEYERYVDDLISIHKKRRLIYSLHEVAALAKLEHITFDEALDQAQAALFEFDGHGSKQGPRRLGEFFPEAIEKVQYASEQPEGMTGVPTGLLALDTATNGWQKGHLIILAARPSKGKTALAVELIKGALAKVPVYVQSIEMNSIEIALRYLSNVTDINSLVLKKGILASDEWEKLRSTAKDSAGINVFIDDDPEVTPTQIRSRARQIKQQHGLGLIIVDYLQIVTSESSKQTRELEVSEIVQSLKNTAKVLQVPVIALAQLSRAADNRGAGDRPRMSDLRESGKIEAAADIIIFIHHELTDEEKKFRDEVPVTLIIEKQRDGPRPDIETRFVQSRSQFLDAMTPESERNPSSVPPPEPPPYAPNDYGQYEIADDHGKEAF